MEKIKFKGEDYYVGEISRDYKEIKIFDRNKELDYTYNLQDNECYVVLQPVTNLYETKVIIIKVDAIVNDIV